MSSFVMIRKGPGNLYLQNKTLRKFTRVTRLPRPYWSAKITFVLLRKAFSR